MPPPRQQQRALDEFGKLFEPDEAVEPILPKGVRGALMEWLTEIWAKAELEAVKLKPRTRALFDGPPGVGKTTLAHHLSARLGLPMLAVRPDQIVDCWVGASARNLGAVFDAMSEDPIVLLFDEFDSIAGKRVEARQSADYQHNDMVNTLLQRLDEHTDGIVIAATNFGTAIDPAVWRRFDIHISLELPGSFERERIIARYLYP